MKTITHIHDLSMRNRDLIKLAGEAVCFSCQEYSAFSEIVEYTDQNETAICPACGIDAMIPTITPNLVQELYNHSWQTDSENNNHEFKFEPS